ncbi:MAG TPA: hypothetical protein DEB48_04355, partial [Verrucomicrobiales bacterium]|nr:hypothetical protein [Verrucomicrobiales bacterium]
MGMKQILVIMAAVGLVGQSGLADEVVVFKSRVIEEALLKQMKKPYGKLASSPKFTEAELAKVTSLNLSLTEATDEDLMDIIELQNLERLDLSYTKITYVDLKEVAKLQKLKKLWLSGTKITDEELKEVAKLQKLE